MFTKMRYRIQLSYDGSAFNGWQIQKNAPSIQEYVQKALSILLKEEVAVTGAGRTDTDVNAVNYTAHFDTNAPDLDAKVLVYKLNAASYLLGTHDFRCFEKKGGNNKTSVCTIEEAAWQTYKPVHASILGFPSEEGDYIVFRIRADRFLRNMVRAIVGSLLEVGRGRQKPDWIKTLLAEGKRSSAGESVPGKALFFNKAEY